MSDFPIKGMTVRPMSCGGNEPALGWPGFLGCMTHAATDRALRTRFIKDTGIRPSEARTERAKEEALARFADWVAENVWGVEGTNHA